VSGQLLSKRLSGIRSDIVQAILAGLGGAFVPLAYAPYDQAWVFLIAWPALVLLLDRARQRSRPFARAALIGWAFGLGQFGAGLYWIGSAFLVEADIFAWVMVPAISLLVAGLSLFPALAAVLSISIRASGVWRIIALSLSIGLSEWLRGHILTGFPWNMPGQAIAFSDISLQSAALFGPDVMNVLVVALAALPAILADGPFRNRAVWGPLAAGLMIGGLLLFYGVHRLSGASMAFVPDVRLRLVQPKTDLAQKWQPDHRREIFSRLLELSEAPGDPTHIIWPEAAPPVILERSPEALAAIGDMLAPAKILLTGAVRVDTDDAGRLTGFYNSLQVINAEGQLLSFYDKSHLVPFGEYLPFRSVFEWLGLREIASHFGPSKPGAGSVSLFAPGLPPFRPLICYESIFSGEIMPRSGVRPDFILIVTDTAWFGASIGPAQHFAQARLRAVETGMPVVQAANAGISGIIDPYGRVHSRLDLGMVGHVDGPLPQALTAPKAPWLAQLGPGWSDLLAPRSAVN
jgi:apolipoprotein N-acyltransferase